jgi:hypothetical protein
MARGTVAGSYDGAVVPSGWTARLEGSNVANWPATTCGMKPALVDEAIAGGASSGSRCIVCRSTPGSSIGTQQDTNIALLRDDFVTLGLGAPDVVIWWLGANDAQDAAELAAYTAGLIRIARLLRFEFPAAVLVFPGERTSDPSSYPFLAEINAVKQAVAAAIPFTYYVDAAGMSLFDAIHPDGTGYADMADRIDHVWRAT